MAQRSEQADPAVIHEVLGSVAVARCLHVIAELGIADRVAERPMTVDDLAAATGAHPDSLYRILRMLAARGIFSEDGERRFHLTAAASILRSGVEGSVRNRLRLAWQDLIWASYGELPHTVMTGEAAFERAHGLPLFDYLAEHPSANHAFDRAMAQISGPEDAAVAAAYDFGRHRLVVDVGGGTGGLLAAVLSRYPDVEGILFDQPQVVASTDHLEGELLERCRVVAGDFFETIPADGDTYVLKRIVHDWDDATAADLLDRCRAAVRGDGRVLVVEAVMRPGNEPDPHKAQDVGMMVLTRGRERTAAEFRSLFGRSGLRLRRIIPVEEGSTLSVLVGVPVRDTAAG
ncbi:MAG: methyltransferase [bacterium]|nr:methyltransferase [bacterium]MDE0289745.1 methyltransferase [bacterium]MDE0439816.1 methyltransferase [bacterium]